jgi:pyruvate/2-oxoglutarate dehydrogenase complex dihydrolipoamide dehydrogenase (E3) component
MPFNPIASDEAGGAGGTCVLRGCVPKKLFVYASEYREAFKDAEGFGWVLRRWVGRLMEADGCAAVRVAAAQGGNAAAAGAAGEP